MDPAILLIIVFIVAPLIERLLKAGKSQDPQQQQRMPRRPPQQRLPQQQRTPPRPTREPVVVRRPQEDDDDAAAAMLPDDLWEILTGERRAPRVPQPPPPVEPDEDEEAESLEDATPDSWIEAQSSHTADTAPVLWERPTVQRPPPEIVSLEKFDVSERARHTQFHQRLDALSEPARVRRAPRNAYSLNTEDELRRAIILAEILGPPKGLE